MDNPKTDENTTPNEITPPPVPDVPASQTETSQEVSPVNSGRNINVADNSIHNTNITNQYISGDLHSPREVESADQKAIGFTPVSSKDREKISAVFQPPEKFSDFLDNVTSDNNDQRVIIITGEGSCGKLSAAIHLGMHLQNIRDSRLQIYNLRVQERLSLYTVVNDSKYPKDSICIITDTFAQGIAPDELCFPNLNSLNDRLIESNSILVILLQSGQLTAQNVELVYNICFGDEFFDLVYWRHFNYYISTNDALKNIFPRSFFQEIKPDILARLDTPSAVDRFFKYIVKQDITSEINKQVKLAQEKSNQPVHYETLSEQEKQEFTKLALIELARRTGGKTSATIFELPRSWFNGLTENQRLYALLVRLFENIDRFSLNELYIQSVDHLRKSGISALCDPRETGFEDILENIHATEEDGFIKFINPDFEREIDRQISNRHALLWTLVDIFEDHIKKLKGPQYWQIRRAYGIAIGRIAQHFPYKLIDELNKLAQHSSGGVVMVAGYALAELCKSGEDYYTIIYDILKGWIDSGDPDYLWAASACSRWVFDALFTIEKEHKITPSTPHNVESIDAFRKKLWELLRDIAVSISNPGPEIIRMILTEVLEESILERIVHNKIDDIKLAKDDYKKFIEKLNIWSSGSISTLSYTLGKIIDLYPQEAIDNITQWTEDKNNDVQLVGTLASYYLIRSEELLREGVIARHQSQFLRFILPLVKNRPDLVPDAIAAILGWLKDVKNSEAFEEILRKQGDFWGQTIIDLNLQQRIALRNAISKVWFQNPSTSSAQIESLGLSILRQIYILEGRPVLLAGNGASMLGIDDSSAARVDRLLSFDEDLFYRLNARLESYAILMGQDGSIGQPEQSYKIPFLSPKPRPRLFIGPIERLSAQKAQNVRLAICLTYGQVIDLIDANDNDLSKCTVIIKPNMVSENQVTGYVRPVRVASTTPQLEGLRFVNVGDDDGKYIDEIEDCIDTILSSYISKLSRDDIFAQLKLDKTFTGDCVESVLAYLRSQTEKTLSIGIKEWRQDPIAHCALGFVWLYKTDTKIAINELCDWMKTDPSNPKRPIYGAAFAYLLLQIALIDQNENWADVYAPLLDLLLPMVQVNGESGRLRMALEFLRRCIRHPQCKMSADKIQLNEYSVFLIDLIQIIKPSECETYRRVLNEWQVDTKGSSSENALVDRLIVLVMSRQKLNLPELSESQKYGVILVRTSKSDTVTDINWWNLKFAQNLAIAWSENKYFKDYIPVIFRYGQVTPLYSGLSCLSADFTHTPVNEDLPMISAPIIENFTPQNTAFILMIDNGSVIDLEDWINLDWYRSTPLIWVSDHPGNELPNSNFIQPKRFINYSKAPDWTEQKPLIEEIFDIFHDKIQGAA